MSISAIVGAAFTAYSGKTLIGGLKEGNLTKAVLGGVGIYMGLSTIGASASTPGQIAANGGTEAGASMLTAEQAGTAADAAAGTAAADNPMLSAIGQEAGGQTVAAAAPGVASGVAPLAAAPGGAALPVTNTLAENKGLLSGIGDWAHNNPMLAYGAMQVGGNMLAGSAKQDWEEKMLKEQHDREDQSRERRGYWAPTPSAMRSRYNPRTGQFEQV